jgi:Cu/Ag efflux protein CusF
MNKSWHRADFLCALVTGAVLTGCSPQRKPSGRLSRYRLRGIVKRLSKSNQVAVIQHEPILADEGKVWMEAMTMEFPVRSPVDYAKLAPGAHLRAVVVQESDGFDYWLEGVEVVPATDQ